MRGMRDGHVGSVRHTQVYESMRALTHVHSLVPSHTCIPSCPHTRAFPRALTHVHSFTHK
jgi:hypothetical protein